MASQGFREINHGGSELVLAAHFNTYGTRLVTGSADHRIRVFTLGLDGTTWELADVWGAHKGEVLDVKWNGGSTGGQVLGSVGQDLRLKIWQEDESQALNSGRRFRNIFTQSAAHRVSYVSLDFKNVRYETFLALVTRDGLLSLLEPVKSDFFDDWREIDQFWVCGDRITRGVETSFKVSFQQSERPNYSAVAAGLDERALSLAVAAMDVVKLYRLVKPEDGTHHFLPPVAELTGAPGLVRDVAWSPAAWLVHDLIATTGNDGYLRIYEVSTPYKLKSDDQVMATEATANSPTHSTAPSPAYPRVPSGISVGLANSSRALSNVRPDTSFSQVQHEWKLVEEIKHEGVWKVEFIRGGNMLVSTGDLGKVHLWRQGLNGTWKEFASFGPEESE